MRDHNSQRPVFLIRVAHGQSRVTDLEAFSRASALLRTEEIPFKVVEASGGDLGEHSVFVIAEEFQESAFNIALANNQSSVTYLDFARVAWDRSRSDIDGPSGKPLGEFKAVDHDHAGEVFVDRNRNQTYAII